jgi:hypothetical protein
MRAEQSKESVPLIVELTSLRQEIRVLRDAVDELAEAVRWQNNNAEDYPAIAASRSQLWTLANETLPSLITSIQFPDLKSDSLVDDLKLPSTGVQKQLF